MATLTVFVFPEEPSDFDIAAIDVSATAGGDTFANAGVTGFWVDNTSGAERTVTFDAPNLCSDGFLHDAAVVVDIAFTGFIAHKFDPARFNTSTGMVVVTYSDSGAGLTVAAVRLA